MREVVGSIPTATTIFDTAKNPPAGSFLEALGSLQGTTHESVISLLRMRISLMISGKNSLLENIAFSFSRFCISLIGPSMRAVGIGRISVLQCDCCSNLL
jgi:hypothetical protein